MKKADELADPRSYMSRARDDEQVFVLLGRDPAAGTAIRCWAKQRVEIGKNEPGDSQIAGALEDAQAMDRASQVNSAEDVALPRAAPTPAWFRRAAARAGLSPGQRDDLLQAMGREFPVDLLLATVVENVDHNIAQSEGEESARAFEYGELVAVDVVMGTARAMLGDMIEIPRPAPPRRTVRVPAGAHLVLHQDLDAEHVHLGIGAQLRCGPYRTPDSMSVDEGCMLSRDRDPETYTAVATDGART